MRVQPAPRDHLAWIASRATLTVHDNLHAIEAVDETGRIHGMIAFDGWTPNSVSMHVALENPGALRRLIPDAFGIAFNRLGKGVVLCTILGTNKRSLRLVEHVGFRQVARLRDAWESGVDLVVVEMRREWCRWIGERKEAA